MARGSDRRQPGQTPRRSGAKFRARKLKTRYLRQSVVRLPATGCRLLLPLPAPPSPSAGVLLSDPGEQERGGGGGGEKKAAMFGSVRLKRSAPSTKKRGGKKEKTVPPPLLPQRHKLALTLPCLLRAVCGLGGGRSSSGGRRRKMKRRKRRRRRSGLSRSFPPLFRSDFLTLPL